MQQKQTKRLQTEDAFERKFFFLLIYFSTFLLSEVWLEKLACYCPSEQSEDFFKSFLIGNSLLPFGILLFSWNSIACHPQAKHKRDQREVSKKREKRANEEKNISAPFSHEIESLSGMWGHVCLACVCKSFMFAPLSRPFGSMKSLARAFLKSVVRLTN